MSRLPFDPDCVRGGEADEPKSSGKAAALTVSQVTDLINQALLDALPRKVAVVGEISNLSRRGHWYFSLKDESAVLRCVAWASKAEKFDFDARDGLSVVARGSIQFYGPQGQTQLYVDSLEPVGAGALELKFRALCEELRGLGYFDPETKQPIPIFPRRVAIVTSSKGAALQDCLDTMRRRCTAVEVLVVDVRVQGAQAGGEIAAALRHLARHHARLRLDAVLLTRGGGSIEDLWAFNERVVADALHRFPIPVVAAIGHETDTTIAELVADLRCATPTQAATRLVPDSRELSVQIDQSARRLSMQMQHRTRYALQHLSGLKRALHGSAQTTVRHQAMVAHRLALRLAPLRPDRVVLERGRRIGLATLRLQSAGQQLIRGRIEVPQTLQHQLEQAVARRAELSRSRVDRAEATLRSVDPRRVLRRGYSITHLADGRVVRSVGDVADGAALLTNVADGTIHSEVRGASARQAKGPPSAKRDRPRRKSRAGPSTDQMELFDHLR